MIYSDYARRKMHNVVKFGTAEGYPLVINNAEGKKLKDYTIEGNTEYGENLFNYTEPRQGVIQSDTDGWYDISIDNTSGTSSVEKYCYTKTNNILKTDTTYNIFVEVAESDKNITVRYVSGFNIDPGQFSHSVSATPSVGTFKYTAKTRTSFNDCRSMLRTFVSCPAGKSGHVKFRIAVYETEKDVFLPYTKTSVGDMTETNKYAIPIVVNGENNTTIYLNAPIADGESINHKADNLPDIVLNKGTNTITTGTAVKPKKIIAKYYKK